MAISNRFIRKKRGSQELALQITSMADIFTILLVFLLKSFSTGATTLAPNENMTLPEALKSAPIIDTVKLEISRGTIILDDKRIATLSQFQFDPADLEANGLPKSLGEAFTRQRGRDTLEKYPKILVLADQGTPYGTLRRVLASAASSGFEDFKLVVVQNQ
jgi:biopolymer transport protein ExbD